MLLARTCMSQGHVLALLGDGVASACPSVLTPFCSQGSGPAQKQTLPMLLLRKGPSSGPPAVSKELAWCFCGENCLETRLVSPAGATQVTSSPEAESVLSEADWSSPCVPWCGWWFSYYQGLSSVLSGVKMSHSLSDIQKLKSCFLQGFQRNKDFTTLDFGATK